jgi:hypothetical protein
MKIIPQSMHNKFGVLMKSLRNGRDVQWTAMGLWLQIYWNDGLGQMFNSLERNDVTNNKHNTVRSSNVTDTLVEETADDEWDKEHIDEIQGTDYKLKKNSNSSDLPLF